MATKFTSNAQVYLSKRFPRAMIMCHEYEVVGTDGLRRIADTMVALDSESATKHGLFAISGFGSETDLLGLPGEILGHLKSFAGNIQVVSSHPDGVTPTVDSNNMVFAPTVIIWTDRIVAPILEIRAAFDKKGIPLIIIEEDLLYKSVFISYGGPDEEEVRALNTALRKRAVKTWFFPDDSIPGQKLHRMMHDGVNSHDRVLLVCSKSSLTRPGVLNEIERVLEREAREGGGDILVPVTLDRFLFDEWAPDRPDIKAQITSRVVITLPDVTADPEGFQAATTRLQTALRATP